MRKCLLVGMPKASARPAPKSYLHSVTVARTSGHAEWSALRLGFKELAARTASRLYSEYSHNLDAASRGLLRRETMRMYEPKIAYGTVFSVAGEKRGLR